MLRYAASYKVCRENNDGHYSDFIEEKALHHLTVGPICTDNDIYST